jgi:hypothetical protein
MEERIMPDGQESANRDLAVFVLTVYDDLDAIVSLREVLFLPPGRTDQYTVDAVRALGEAWSEIVDDRDNHVTGILDLDETDVLAPAGLSGAQLRLKIAVWRRARAAMITEFGNSEDAKERSSSRPEPTKFDARAEKPAHPRKLPRRVRVALKLVASMLSYADTILGSLARLAGQHERLKEFKETVERLSGDMADEYPEVD